MTGFKKGSAGSPFDDDVEDDEPEPKEQAEPPVQNTSSNTAMTQTQPEPEPTVPYVKQRRIEEQKTTWKRDRVTFYVRDVVESGERDLIATAESAFDRDIPKFDVREAAYLAAQRNPDLVLDELERMGYDRD